MVRMFCVGVASLLSLSLNASANEETKTATLNKIIEPFKAEYTILHKSDPVGKGVRSLTYLDDNSAEYSYQTKIKWLIFSDKRKEKTKVSLNGYSVTPLHYKYEREGTGRDKYYEWSFDVSKNTARNIKEKKNHTIDFPKGIQDKLSYHLQNRLALIKNPEQKTFTYPVVSTSGSIKDYEFEYDGEEEVLLPIGLVKAIRLKREVKRKERVTYAWFAPEYNYLLVKLYQSKGGNEQFEAQLNKVTALTKENQ